MKGDTATVIKGRCAREQRHHPRGRHRSDSQVGKELERATGTWPGDPRVLRARADLFLVGREYAAARPLLEDLLKREPGSAELCLLLGETWIETKEPAQAIPVLERAAAADPGLLRARAALGRAYVEDGQAARAVGHLVAALPGDEDGSVHLQLARAYRETGQAEQAARTLLAFQALRKAYEARMESDKQEFAITAP